MAKVEMSKVEERPDHRLLFNVSVDAGGGRAELPIGIQELGSAALDEAAVLRSALHFAEDLAASIRSQLKATTTEPTP